MRSPSFPAPLRDGWHCSHQSNASRREVQITPSCCPPRRHGALISAIHSWFGPDAVKLRSTKSGAGRASLSRRVVGGPPRRWQAPTSPAARIRRAIRLRPCLSPPARRSAWTRGAPYVWRRAGVHGPDALQQRCVSDGMGGRRTTQPGVVARLGHAEHARHGGNREAGLVCAHEPEDPDGSVPWTASPSFPPGERPADASPGQTRPRLLTRCPAPAGVGAPHGAGAPARRARPRPGLAQPPPDGPPACRPRTTQARIECDDGSNSRAKSSGDRPARTRSTIWRRNSGE
jgi:hypothetical protein